MSPPPRSIKISTEMLFERIRGVVKTGTPVIYITHRLAELRQIAQRVTVLRDGRAGGEDWSMRSRTPTF